MVACSSADDAPRPEVMDTTAHVGSCSVSAAKLILAVCAVMGAVHCLLCRPRLRQSDYGEDAPELEACSSADGRCVRRLDSYGVKAGRLTTGAAVSSGKQDRRHTKKRAGGEELEPVLPTPRPRR